MSALCLTRVLERRGARQIAQDKTVSIGKKLKYDGRALRRKRPETTDTPLKKSQEHAASPWASVKSVRGCRRAVLAGSPFEKITESTQPHHGQVSRACGVAGEQCSQATPLKKSQESSAQPHHGQVSSARGCRRAVLAGGPTNHFVCCRSRERTAKSPETRSLLTVDHSARGSMKDAASCEKWCDLQSTLIVDNLNVHYGSALRKSRGLVRLRVSTAKIYM